MQSQMNEIILAFIFAILAGDGEILSGAALDLKDLLQRCPELAPKIDLLLSKDFIVNHSNDEVN